MSLKLEAIHHVAVIGTDYARSRHFYAELLGLPVIREHRREAEGDWKIDLQLGDAELELFIKPDAPPRKSYPEAQGLRHLAFRVASVAETAEKLKRSERQASAWSPSAPMRTPAKRCVSSLTRTAFRSSSTNEQAEKPKTGQTKKAAHAAFFVVAITESGDPACCPPGSRSDTRHR